jgi:hypothetical protein
LQHIVQKLIINSVIPDDINVYPLIEKQEQNINYLTINDEISSTVLRNLGQVFQFQKFRNLVKLVSPYFRINPLVKLMGFAHNFHNASSFSCSNVRRLFLKRNSLKVIF